MIQKYYAWLIDWVEFERGWGQRPDGTTVHKTKEEADRYVNEYWAKMNEEYNTVYAPNLYAKELTRRLSEVPKDVYCALEQCGTFWISPNEWWEMGMEYQIPRQCKKETDMDITKLLRNLTVEELEIILNEKKQELKNVPPRLENINVDKLGETVLNYLKKIADGGCENEDDDERYIFEEVIETFYGKEIWKWINKTRGI